MDLNDVRTGFTLLSFVLFAGLAWHTWHRRRRSEHEAAAQLIFQGEDATESRQHKDVNHG